MAIKNIPLVKRDNDNLIYWLRIESTGDYTDDYIIPNVRIWSFVAKLISGEGNIELSYSIPDSETYGYIESVELGPLPFDAININPGAISIRAIQTNGDFKANIIIKAEL